MHIKKGQEITVAITDAAYEGKGLGRIGEQVVFIKNTAPGDVVEARVIKRKKNFLEGKLLRVVQAGTVRIDPVCSHAGICGGCTWQHVTYNEQLRFKHQHVKDHMHRIGGFTDVDVLPALRSDEQLYYRNKMEYTFGDRRWLTDEEINSGDPIPDKDIAAGMHIPGRFDRILNLDECHLQIPVSWRIMNFVRDYAIRMNIPPYNAVKHEGFFRNVMIRNAVHSGDLLVNIVTYEDDPDIMTDLTAALLAVFPEITTVVNNVNDTWSPASEGRYENMLHGPGYITESIGGYRFKISSNTFFQTNTRQAEKLYQKALDFADLKGNELVYDLYCGVGSLTLFVSGKCKQVVGIEINPESIRKARENAAENEVTNCRFETGDMKDAFTTEHIEKYGRPDVIITDPPRAGMHPDVIATLLETGAKTIVYVSCNSATQARDLALLNQKYRVDAVQPVDMFPQTYHIESVAKLTLNKSG
ncbi:MAG: 23S rRNA (uracil(1939)-C(5))-methyltransferase RlmD [Rhodothermaceae bacterium]|nr:23S rRNA (uracil(1939)-C(5))-methyltransferase RlmD [Rhodothermaceae bacterium]